MTVQPEITMAGLTGRPMSEKRAELRAVTPAFAVKVIGECRRTYGYARDLSRTGMQVRTFSFCSSTPKPAGERVVLEFKLPENDIPISCKAEIKWNVVPPHGPDTINLQGITFVELAPELRDMISEWVDVSVAA